MLKMYISYSISRTYAIRRVRDAFREKKNVDDFHEIQSLVYRAKENLEIIQRQVRIVKQCYLQIDILSPFLVYKEINDFCAITLQFWISAQKVMYVPQGE